MHIRYLQFTAVSLNNMLFVSGGGGLSHRESYQDVYWLTDLEEEEEELSLAPRRPRCILCSQR